MNNKYLIAIILILFFGLCVQIYNLHSVEEEITFMENTYIPNVVNSSHELGRMEGCNRPDDKAEYIIKNNGYNTPDTLIYKNQCGDTYTIVNGIYRPYDFDEYMDFL